MSSKGLGAGERACRCAALITLASAAAAGCAGPAADGRGLLPQPALDHLAFSAYQPERPLESVKPGLAARASFAAAADGYVIEVRDFMVAPGEQPVAIEIRGAGAFEVRDGNGVVSVAGKILEVAMGATFGVSQGAALTVKARGGPLALRAHLFVVQPR